MLGRQAAERRDELRMTLQVHRPDAEPTCDPNVDGIGLRQRTTRDGCGRLDEKRGDHKLYS